MWAIEDEAEAIGRAARIESIRREEASPQPKKRLRTVRYYHRLLGDGTVLTDRRSRDPSPQPLAASSGDAQETKS